MNTRSTRILMSALLPALLAGNAAAAAPGPAKPAGDARHDVETALQEYARLLKATDAAGLAACYTADGELLDPGMDALKGREAIRAFLASFGEVRIESASMTPDATEVFGDQAFQWGAYSQRVVVPGKPAAGYSGRFVAQWSRQADGRWLIRRLLTQPSPGGP
jgi:uncharacterized protein (TIGR02246 family)